MNPTNVPTITVAIPTTPASTNNFIIYKIDIFIYNFIIYKIDIFIIYIFIKRYMNDTNEDKFLFEIDKSIETGNYNIIISAIKLYKNLINDTYITMAERIYQELLCERFEEINI